MNSSARPEFTAPAAALRHGAFIACCAMILFLTTARADPRASTSYTITTDTSDAGGKRATSANYTNEGSAGGIVGTSTVATPAETAKHGYMGQITEVSAVQIAATPNTVNETATRQLSATALLDDLTSHAIPANSITWSVASGPLTSIDTTGLATASTVYQNTVATAQGIYGGTAGTLNLTVINTLPDNFGTYAGDGIADDWQFQYFGLNNANAAPLLDPDFDGHTNLFEFTAGLIPSSSISRFLLTNQRPIGQPGQMNVVINPRFSDRTYTVKSSLTLGPAAVWIPLTSPTITDNGLTRTFTDPSATQPAKFYKVEITKP
jgi:hypothetical protein